MDRRGFLKSLGLACAALTAPKAISDLLPKLAPFSKPPQMFGCARFKLHRDFEPHEIIISSMGENIDEFEQFRSTTMLKLWWPEKSTRAVVSGIQFPECHLIKKGTIVEGWFAPLPGEEKNWKPMEARIVLNGVAYYTEEDSKTSLYQMETGLREARLDRDRAVELGLAAHGEDGELVL